MIIVVWGSDDGDAGEYERALLEVRLSELAGEIGEVYRRVLSLDDRVADLTGLVALVRRQERAEGMRGAEQEPWSDAEPEFRPTPDASGDGPVVRVLGPVVLDGARGTVNRSHVGQLTEIAAYLVLHPGTTSEDLDNAIWPGEPNKTASRTQACSRLRHWLGSDHLGHRYFPHMSDGHYRLASAVRTDWDDFRALVPADPASVPTERLEAALGLVTGQPFTGATGRRPKYRWADRLKSEMIIAITDTATTVAERALDANEPSRARAAAEAGLQAEPGMEQLWRQLLRAEHHAGNRIGLRGAVNRLHRQLDDLGTDPEPETARLIQQLLPTRQWNARPSRQG